MISAYRPFFDQSEILALLRPGIGRREFELAVASRVGARYALSFAYGRSGIVALFKTLGLSQAEVIMPAYTCAVMAEAVVASGNKPVFVDADLADYNMDMDAMKRALTPETRAIIATHLYGYPTDVNAIRNQVGDDGVLIVEDAALALRPATGTTGISGDVALFSFGSGKQLYTITGGVVVTNSPSLYERLKEYRDREMSQLPRSVWARRLVQVLTAYMAQSGWLEEKLVQLKNMRAVKRTREAVGLVQDALPQDYATVYADFQGRVGMTQLNKLCTALERTRSLAAFYDKELRDMPGLTRAPIIPGATYTYYSIRIEKRDQIRFRQRMHGRGIEVGQYFGYALPYLKAYQTYARGQYPRAEQIAREIVNLPNYPGLNATEARRVVESTQQVMQESLS